jgi:type 1 fimbria pilin
MKMKRTKLVKSLAATAIGGALTVAGALAFAADTADLTVKGNIIPSACAASFSDGGVADFGTIKTADLNPNGFTNVGKRKLNLNVSCKTMLGVTFNVADNQGASSLGQSVASTLGVPAGDAATYVFGLGSTEVNGQPVSLGSYALDVTDGEVTVDNTKHPMVVATSADSMLWAIYPDHVGHSPNLNYGAQTLTFKLRGMNFSFPLTVVAAINKGSLLPLNADVPLNGNATFNITYN